MEAIRLRLFPNPGMLLGKNCAKGSADPPRQRGIQFATPKEIPRIASARNHLSDIEAAVRHVKQSRRVKGAAIRQQAQNAAFAGKSSASRL